MALPVFDLTPEALDIGDTVEFVNKMNSLFVKLQTWADAVDAAMGSTDAVTALQNAVTALETADQAEANNRETAVSALQDAIDALNTALASLSIGDVQSLTSKLATQDESLGRETANRSAADVNLSQRIDELSGTIEAMRGIGGVDLSALQATSDQIAQLIASAGGLTVGSIAGLEDDLRVIGQGTPLNVLPDWGRLVNNYYRYSGGSAFTTSGLNTDATNEDFSIEYAGLRASQFASITNHRHVSNAIHNGGTRDIPIGSEVDSLFAAIFQIAGGSNYVRHAPEFHIADITVRSDPAYPASSDPLYHLLARSGYVTGMGDYWTMAYWVWLEAQDDMLLYSSKSYINGVSQQGVIRPRLSAGWQHVCVNPSSSVGYVSSIAHLYGKAGIRFMFAMPALFRGRFQVTPRDHTRIIGGIPYVA